jgi:hypothetical protein
VGYEITLNQIPGEAFVKTLQVHARAHVSACGRVCACSTGLLAFRGSEFRACSPRASWRRMPHAHAHARTRKRVRTRTYARYEQIGGVVPAGYEVYGPALFEGADKPAAPELLAIGWKVGQRARACTRNQICTHALAHTHTHIHTHCHAHALSCAHTHTTRSRRRTR